MQQKDTILSSAADAGKTAEDALDTARRLVRNRSCQAGRPLTANVKTFGCQMNERDSEKIRGILLEAGYEPVTVSGLFGYDPPETGDEVFIYDPSTYKYPEIPKDYLHE